MSLESEILKKPIPDPGVRKAPDPDPQHRQYPFSEMPHLDKSETFWHNFSNKGLSSEGTFKSSTLFVSALND